jgi:hypothetical protein
MVRVFAYLIYCNQGMHYKKVVLRDTFPEPEDFCDEALIVVSFSSFFNLLFIALKFSKKST